MLTASDSFDDYKPVCNIADANVILTNCICTIFTRVRSTRFEYFIDICLGEKKHFYKFNLVHYLLTDIYLVVRLLT